MHKPTSCDFTEYVKFTDENLKMTSKGLRYEYQGYWYLIDENTEFVF